MICRERRGKPCLMGEEEAKMQIKRCWQDSVVPGPALELVLSPGPAVPRPSDADLAPRVTFPHTEKPLQGLQPAPKSLAGDMALISAVISSLSSCSSESMDVHRALLLHVPRQSPHFLQPGNTFRRHPRHALGKDSFYTTQFSQFPLL